jgi:hypothetical protein
LANKTSGVSIEQLAEYVKNNDFNSVAKILSKDEALAEKFMDLITNDGNFVESAAKLVESMENLITSNDKSSDHLFQLFKDTRQGLQHYLDNNGNNMAPEERAFVREQIQELVRMAIKLDADNKSWLMKMASNLRGTVGFLALGAAALALLKLRSNEDGEAIVIDAELKKIDN